MLKHPDTDLVPYLRGELPPADRERVARHLEECPDCRQDTERLPDLLGQLSRSIGQPREVNWAHCRAELRGKLEARRGRRVWWWRPAPFLLSASVAGALLLLAAVWGGRETLTGADPFTLEEASIGRQLGLLQEYQVGGGLDLLDDLELIRDLDGLSSGRQG